MKPLRFLGIINIIVYFVSVFISYASNARVFGKTNAEVSNKYETLFTPAGYTFSIWGLIYTALTVLVIYHTLKVFRAEESDRANQDFKSFALIFIVNNIAASLWVLAFSSELLIVSALLLLTQLFCILLINLKLNIYRPEASLVTKAITQFPFSIYFAWLTMASIANISCALKGIGWDGGGLSPELWTIILIIIATALTLFITIKRKNIFYGPVIVWALFGIAAKLKFKDALAFATITYVIWVAVSLIALGFFVQLIKNAKSA